MNSLSSSQQLLLILLFIFIFLISFFIYRSDIVPNFTTCPEKTIVQENNDKDKTAITETIPTTKDTLVLVWNWPWGEVFSIDKCTEFGFTGCKLSADKSLFGIADGVAIHHADIMENKNSLPQQTRPFFQIWVWVNVEPPLVLKNLHFADDLFNLTMTFRQDSDIYIPYGRMITMKEPQNFTIPKKSKLVSWVVSKWYPGVPRIAYYEELKKHIPIDVYGREHIPLSAKDFHPTISQYKFYLCFENSIYKDYITEKLWYNSFGSWAVPVVLGTSRENYERFVPGDAFIHVDDFPSAKKLADYLLELDKDDVKYQKYFNWRSRYYVKLEHGMAGWSYHYCKACDIIKKNPRFQTSQQISKWFLKDV